MNSSNGLAALSAINTHPRIDSVAETITAEDIILWKKHFRLESEEVRRAIEVHRADKGGRRLAREVWEDVCIDTGAHLVGWTKELFEHLSHTNQFKSTAVTDDRPKSEVVALSKLSQKPEYLVRLKGLLFNENQVITWGDISPPLRRVQGLTRKAERREFVELTPRQLTVLIRSLPACVARQLEVLKIDTPPAVKDLSRHSIAPVLGLSTATLPQFRLGPGHDVPRPLQHEYPVKYFFYDALAWRAKLMTLLGLDLWNIPIMERARVRGCRVKKWGKYSALVNGERSDEVGGMVYEIPNQEVEQKILAFQTAKFEVVRCKMQFALDGAETWGLTFRFCGRPESLRESYHKLCRGSQTPYHMLELEERAFGV